MSKERGTMLSSQMPESKGTMLSSQMPESRGTMLGSQMPESKGTMLSSQMPESRGTMLGSQMSESRGTMLGSQMPEGQGTMLSTQATDKKWIPGLLLQMYDRVGEYVIVDFISKSGEAEIYKGVKDRKEYAIKLYLYEVSLKNEVVEKLVGKQFKNLAHMEAWGKTRIQFRQGEYLEKFYEVSPIYQVIKKPMPYAQLRDLIAQVNEGLHELHQMNIFHKDIKPANIMQDNDGTYRIIDFGISSVAEVGQSHINNTVTGISQAYASPETRATATAGPREDYYSLGISIYELFTGELPYAELGSNNNRYVQLNSIGVKVRESLNMPNELIKLIHGLTFYSNDPVLKKKRWGYNEIKQWLTNPDDMEDLDMDKSQSDNRVKTSDASKSKATTVYKKRLGFANEQLENSFTLANTLGSNWKEGKKLVGRGYLEDFFQENGSEYVSYRIACGDTKKEMEDASTTEQEDVAYWKLLYLLEPKLDKFYWCEAKEDGSTSYTCAELGVYFFLKPMQEKKGNEIPRATRILLNSGLLPIYLKNYLKDEDKYQKAVKLIKEYQEQDKEKAIWKLGYLLTGKAIFRYHNQNFESKDVLYKHILDWTNSLSRNEALAVVNAFQNTKEFQAWCETQEEN